ncbi:MAG: endonuclease MutS2 [Brevinematia bacterium]
MNQFKLKSYEETLEFDSVLQLIKSFLKTEAGKNIASRIKPFQEKQSILSEFAILREVVEFLKYDGRFHFEEASSIEEFLKTAEIEGYFLYPLQILEIQKYLTIYKNLCEAIASYEDKYPLLSSHLDKMILPDNLLKKLTDTFEADGSIKDSATKELYNIRQRKYLVRDEIQKKCNSIFQSQEFQDCFQEKIVTFKDGRFLIPIKTSHKNRLRAITNFVVHSFSNTRETAFIEPESLFYLNEEVLELEERENAEIEAILKEITHQIAENSQEIKKIYEVTGKIEWLSARAKFCIKNDCHFPEIVDDYYIRLTEARHPLLFENAVPVSVEVGKSFNGLIVSGPNAGGKTVLIKTVGLLTMMALYGIPVPAKKSEIGLFTKIMAEIGDEQSISNNLSSFSGHILSLSRILNEADEKSLILIDEIASSTEPKEGEAISYGIIKELIERKAKFIITTHYQGLKKMALLTDDLENASMEFDLENFTPNYRLQMGKFGKSYAIEIAQKYGLSQKVLDDAKTYLLSISDELDKRIADFERLTDELMKKKALIEENIKKAKELKSFYEKIKNEMEIERENFKKREIEKIKLEYEDLLKDISLLKNEVRSRKIEDRKKFEEKLDEIKKLIENEEKKDTLKEKARPQKLSAGDRVYVLKYKKDGYVETISEDKVKVRIGLVSVFVNRDEIFVSSKQEENKFYRGNIEVENTPFVIDVRGMRVEKALKIVEKAVDNAIINGNSAIEIIHGKGEGILKKAIHNYLRDLSDIKSFDYAKPEEGGQGKTIVIFK